MPDNALAELAAEDPPKRKRGRPPGRKNDATIAAEAAVNPVRLAPEASVPFEDYRHADMGSIIERQITMLDWAQQACRNEMKSGMQKDGKRIDLKDVEKLESLAQSIIRTVDALKKYEGVAAEIEKRLTPAQLLEWAIAKIEGQDTATLNAIIKRLRATRALIAPVNGLDKIQLGEPSAKKEQTAVDAMRALVDE